MGTHESFLRATIVLAKAARDKGNHPFGSLLVIQGNHVLSAENTVVTDRDCTRHAELNLISQASRQFDGSMLVEATLYASTEPCAMCAGAIFWSGVRTVVYACSAETLANYASDSFVIPSRQIFARARETTTVIGPLIEEEAALVHEDFWRP